jgi:hypothetical protein
VSFDITIKSGAARSKLLTLRAEFDAIAAKLPGEAAEMAAAEARSTTAFKDRTGKTRGSIKARQMTPYKWRFVAGGTSWFHNYGTGEAGVRGARYPIVPRDPNGFLVFKDRAGRWNRRKMVMHPGVPRTEFVDHAVDHADFFFELESMRRILAVIAAHNS